MDINILPNNEILKLSDSCFNVDYKKTLVHQVITSYSVIYSGFFFCLYNHGCLY